MYYDVEAALLSTFRVDDTQLHTTWDEERRIIATVQLTRSVPSLSSLTHAFYRFWGQVCLARSEVRRDLGDDTISFRFQTSNGSLDYHGVVIFRGQPVQALLHRLHS